jgi:hypothetical protein
MIAARRLAAILAADVVCFSRLLGEDEGDGAGGLRTSRRGPSSLARSISRDFVRASGMGRTSTASTSARSPRKRFAVARPIPRAAPVTSALWP